MFQIFHSFPEEEGEREESDERILGSEDFLQAILQEIEGCQLRQLRLRRKGLTIKGIIEDECVRAGVSARELIDGSPRNPVSRARGVIAHRCIDEIGMAAAEVARHLGMTTSNVTRAVEKIRGQNHK